MLVSETGEIWRWDGFTSKGKQNTSTKAVLEQLKNRRLKQLSAEEKQWQDIMATAQKRIDELHQRKTTLEDELVRMQSMPENISSEKEKLLKSITNYKKDYEKSYEYLNNIHESLTRINQAGKGLLRLINDLK